MDHQAAGIWRRSLAIALGLALLKVAIHLPIIENYGYHHDEYYFIACAENLSWGYVDHPPLIPWIAALAGRFGDYALWALRLPAVLAGAAMVSMTALFVRSLGGDLRAQGLAGLAAMAAPVWLRANNMLNIPSFEPVTWLGLAFVTLHLLRTQNPRWWIAFGLIAGIGLLTKYPVMLWAGALLIGMLTVPGRRVLATPWLVVGGCVALLIAAPNVYWQATHEWAALEFLRGISDTVLQRQPRVLVVLGQVLYLHPVVFGLCMAGASVPFLFDRWRGARPFAVAFAVVFLVLLIQHGKPYYGAPAYLPVLAVGAAWLTGLGRPRVVIAYTTALVVLGLPLAFASLPVLPVRTIDDGLSYVLPQSTVPRGELTRDLHYQVRWTEFLDASKAHYDAMAATDPAPSILAAAYARASAIAFAFERDEMPMPASRHMTWYLWSRDRDLGSRVLAIGFQESELADVFEDVVELGQYTSGDGADVFSPIRFHACSRPKRPWPDLWPRLKRYRFG